MLKGSKQEFIYLKRKCFVLPTGMRSRRHEMDIQQMYSDVCQEIARLSDLKDAMQKVIQDKASGQEPEAADQCFELAPKPRRKRRTKAEMEAARKAIDPIS
jgi:hypothetical protein